VAIPHNKACAASGCIRSSAGPKGQADIYYSPKKASKILKTPKLPQQERVVIVKNYAKRCHSYITMDHHYNKSDEVIRIPG